MSDPATLDASVRLELAGFTLDVELETGARVTGLFGPSGCGKSSFIECIAGLRPRARGRVSFGDVVWQDSERGVWVAPHERGIGYVPQDGLLFPHKSVRANVEMGLRRARRQGRADGGLWNGVVELFELGGLLDRPVATLSGGERQRVSLGRALCSAPALMLLDEPLAALDQPLRRRILPFLRRVREEFRVPMLFVSHDPIDVQALCDDLVVLRDGVVVGRGAPRDVLTDPSVFPLADERGFENVIPCSTLSTDASRTKVRLGPADADLTLTVINRSPVRGPARLVGIPARDVLVATARPSGLSARNVLPAVIEEVHAVGNVQLIKARLDERLPLLAVEVGREAVEELALRPGKSVFLIVKAMSCTLYEESFLG